MSFEKVYRYGGKMIAMIIVGEELVVKTVPEGEDLLYTNKKDITRMKDGSGTTLSMWEWAWLTRMTEEEWGVVTRMVNVGPAPKLLPIRIRPEWGEPEELKWGMRAWWPQGIILQGMSPINKLTNKDGVWLIDWREASGWLTKRGYDSAWVASRLGRLPSKAILGEPFTCT